MTDKANEGAYERRSEVFKSPRALTSYWINALELAKEAEKKWRKSADDATDIYNGKKKPAFDILYANTEITRSAIYNSVPVPDIRTRHGDRDEVARKGAMILERALLYSLDEYDFDDTLKNTALDLSLVSRGVVRVKYVPLMRTVEAEDENGKTVQSEEVAWQMAPCEFVPYTKFRHGPGATWAEVPWVAFETAMSRDEIATLEGMDEKTLAKIPLDMSDGDFDDKEVPDSEKSVFRHARVWQVWDKDTRTVFLIAPGFDDRPVAMIEDPLGLLDFFPCPRPVYFLRSQGGLTPLTPYEKYKKQAEELNRVSTRMHALVSMLKIRGVRASEVPEIEAAFSLGDGEFAPSEGAMAALGGGKGLDDAIWMMPIDKIIRVVRELASQREQIKATIYEIGGIADIMRGATDPGETLGAQNLKSQFGSMRMSDVQRDLQRFVADIFKLKAQIIANKFSHKTLSLIAGEDVAEEVIEFLRTDVIRTYKIDIETDSTIRGDLVRSQRNMIAFLDGTSRFAQQMATAVQAGIVPKDLALTVFSAFARQFKLGKELEDKLSFYMEQAEQASQQQPDPAQQQKQQQAEQIAETSNVLAIQSKQIDNQKKAAEVEGQKIENVIQATTGGTEQQGFVQ